MTGLAELTNEPLAADWPFLLTGSSRGSRAALPRLLRRFAKALERAPLTATARLDSEAFFLSAFRSRRFFLREESSLLVDDSETLAVSSVRFLECAWDGRMAVTSSDGAIVQLLGIRGGNRKEIGRAGEVKEVREKQKEAL